MFAYRGSGSEKVMCGNGDFGALIIVSATQTKQA
jgi:hypothetical protein